MIVIILIGMTIVTIATHDNGGGSNDDDKGGDI